MCIQTETIDVDEKNDADVEKMIEEMKDNEFITTNFDDECSSSDEDLDDDIKMSSIQVHFTSRFFFRFGENIEPIFPFCTLLCSL